MVIANTGNRKHPKVTDWPRRIIHMYMFSSPHLIDTHTCSPFLRKGAAPSESSGCWYCLLVSPPANLMLLQQVSLPLCLYLNRFALPTFVCLLSAVFHMNLCIALKVAPSPPPPPPRLPRHPPSFPPLPENLYVSYPSYALFKHDAPPPNLPGKFLICCCLRLPSPPHSLTHSITHSRTHQPTHLCYHLGRRCILLPRPYFHPPQHHPPLPA